MVETEVSLLQALQHRISDRILALAQHALDTGMKYAVLDIHRQDGLICVITASYPMAVAEGIAKTAVHRPCRVQPFAGGQPCQHRRLGHRPSGTSNPGHPLTGIKHAHCH